MTERKTRNTSPLTVGAALDKIRERLSTQRARELEHAQEFLNTEEEWHAKIAVRVPEEEWEALAKAIDAIVPVVEFKARNAPEEFDARGVLEPLSPERKAVAGLK
jgi:hypothetical protein